MTRIALFQSNTGIDPGGQCRALWPKRSSRRRRRRGNAVHAGNVGPARPRRRSGRARNLRPRTKTGCSPPAARRRREHRIWLHLGSLAVLADDGKVANRGFVIDREGDDPRDLRQDPFVRRRLADRRELARIERLFAGRGRGAGQRHAGRQARPHHLLRPALPGAVRAARGGRRRRDRGSRGVHRADRQGALARAACGPGRSRPGCSSSLPRRSGATRTAARPTAIRWSSIRGARCCSTWARSAASASPTSTSSAFPTCARAFRRSATAGRSPTR